MRNLSTFNLLPLDLFLYCCMYFLKVEVNVAIRSMGPVDEMSQTIQLDCYFRQFWEDKRLKFNGTKLTELPMNWQFLTKIWRPDTVIINGKDSTLHKITVRQGVSFDHKISMKFTPFIKSIYLFDDPLISFFL